MACLIFLRHGESVANSELRFTHSDDEPLTPLGVEQARATGGRLARRYRPVALYASPLRRAFQTALMVGETLGLEPQVVDALHEQDFGSLRGQPYTEFYGRVVGLAAVERWSVRPPGGESLLDVMSRVAPVLDALAEQHRGQEAVVVCHGGVLAALRGHLLGLEEGPQSTGNASGYVVSGGPGRYEGPLPLEQVLS